MQACTAVFLSVVLRKDVL